MDKHRYSVYDKPILSILSIVIFILLSSQNLIASSDAGFSSEKAGFSVKFKDEVSPYRVIGVFVLPEETLTLQVLDKGKKHRYHLQTSTGKVTQIRANTWHWQAPLETGLYLVKIIHPQSLDDMTFNIFVMFPYNQLKGEYLNGYRIGEYPTVPLKQLPIYKPPSGFIEVTKANEETLVAPHFKLKQFLCKQEDNYPKYVVLRERLLLKLELILEKANEQGYRCDTFHIMSGYRTPCYNKAIGNVTYSRHVWGDATDIFIDENPKDGNMDDLNHDGEIDYQDAAILYTIINDIDDSTRMPSYQSFAGGLGVYEKTAYHGPFVHVDVRGFRARWGIELLPEGLRGEYVQGDR
ncbi:peptidase M15A [Candidatus Poribacteria bacterium]|nr:peptidase M15A [Candidatus Poribacteria bacterium]